MDYIAFPKPTYKRQKPKVTKIHMQDKKECWVCQTTLSLEEHHIFFGEKNRKWSDLYGLVVWLCTQHHTGQEGVHHIKPLDDKLKGLAQEKFEQVYSHNEFLRIFKGVYRV